jgi:hypothetical protein
MHKGILVAGLANILGVLLFSKGFQNPHLGPLFPALFGNWGLLCIMLWGLAYLSVAKSYRSVPALLLVFTLEKALYVVSWLFWLLTHGSQLPAIWALDSMTAIFYCLYGLLDFVFALVFWGAYRECRHSL